MTFQALRTFLWVFSTIALVSSISDSSTREKTWGVLKEGVDALSYIPGFAVGTVSTQDSTTTSNSSGDESPHLFTRGLHIIEKTRLLKADTTDDDASTTSTATVSAGGGAAVDEDAGASDDATDDATTLTMESSNKTSIIPPEPEEQPKEWPATVLVIFLVLTAVMLGLTGIRNCRKKSQYTEVPTTSLIV